MTLGERINYLRKQKGFSQAELGSRISTSGDIIGRYERNEVKPSIEVIVRMADILEVSIDYLVGKSDVELDTNTLNRVKEVSKLPQEERIQIFKVIDALIRDYNAKKAYAS